MRVSVLAFTALRAVEAALPEYRGSALERLGRTRPAVLVRVTRRRTRTTSEVARAGRIALSGADHQLAVLRDEGLVASHREGEFVRHSVMSMGHRLLGADPRRREETDPGRRTETGPASGP